MLTDDTARKLDQLTARCSSFSRRSLIWAINIDAFGEPYLVIQQPGQPESVLKLSVDPITHLALLTGYGHLRQWQFTHEDQQLVLQALKESRVDPKAPKTEAIDPWTITVCFDLIQAFRSKLDQCKHVQANPKRAFAAVGPIRDQDGALCHEPQIVCRSCLRSALNYASYLLEDDDAGYLEYAAQCAHEEAEVLDDYDPDHPANDPEIGLPEDE